MSPVGTTLPHALGGTFGGRQRKQFVTLLALSWRWDGNDQNRELEPPYSPDFNPIEMVFHPLKTFLRKAAERTIERLQRCVRSYIRALDPSERMGYFTHAGYEPS